MSGDSRPRPDVVAFYRAMLPAEQRANHTFDVDDRFAPPGEPPRTELGRYCDRILSGPPVSDPRVLHVDALDYSDGALELHGRRDGGHPSTVVIDLTDPRVRLALVTVAGVICRHDLDPDHQHTTTHPREAIT